MKVFVSSLITGMEPLRAAAREAIETLRHDPLMAEDFGAQPSSPEVACLTGLRQADVVVLILGEHYGTAQSSGISATHQEYEEAKGRKPVLAFVQEGVQFDPAEATFIREVQGWEGGLFRGGFRAADDLRRGITRALHDYALANATGPVDPAEMMQRAMALLPAERRSTFSGGAALNLAISGGPLQSILRPVDLEKPALSDSLKQHALFGEHRLFAQESGTRSAIGGDALVIEQERGARVLLNEQCSVLISVPVKHSSQLNQMMRALVYEDILQQVTDALGYASWTMDLIDSTQRLTHVAMALSLTEADYMPWRTRREVEERPNSGMSVGSGNQGGARAQTSQVRAALRLSAGRIAEDLVVPLRRQWR